MNKTLVVDLDGTLCEQTPGGAEYLYAEPKRETIRKVNSLKESGWRVVIHTARGMNRCDGCLEEIERLFRQMTEWWLTENDVKYDELVFGKPAGDLYVDDKGMGADEFTASDIC